MLPELMSLQYEWKHWSCVYGLNWSIYINLLWKCPHLLLYLFLTL